MAQSVTSPFSLFAALSPPPRPPASSSAPSSTSGASFDDHLQRAGQSFETDNNSASNATQAGRRHDDDHSPLRRTNDNDSAPPPSARSDSSSSSSTRSSDGDSKATSGADKSKPAENKGDRKKDKSKDSPSDDGSSQTAVATQPTPTTQPQPQDSPVDKVELTAAENAQQQQLLPGGAGATPSITAASAEQTTPAAAKVTPAVMAVTTVPTVVADAVATTATTTTAEAQAASAGEDQPKKAPKTTDDGVKSSGVVSAAATDPTLLGSAALPAVAVLASNTQSAPQGALPPVKSDASIASTAPASLDSAPAKPGDVKSAGNQADSKAPTDAIGVDFQSVLDSAITNATADMPAEHRADSKDVAADRLKVDTGSPATGAKPVVQQQNVTSAVGPAASARTGAPGSVSSPNSTSQTQGGASVDAARFVQRVTRAFQAASEQNGPIRLRLSPPELGAVKIEMTVKDGAMTAHLQAETESARSMLLDQLPALRDRLADHNIKIDKFDVELMNNSSTSTPQNFGNSRDNYPSPDAGSRRGGLGATTTSIAAATSSSAASIKAAVGQIDVTI